VFVACLLVSAPSVVASFSSPCLDRFEAASCKFSQDKEALRLRLPVGDGRPAAGTDEGPAVIKSVL
jgi:hypothetical protein